MRTTNLKLLDEEKRHVAQVAALLVARWDPLNRGFDDVNDVFACSEGFMERRRTRNSVSVEMELYRRAELFVKLGGSREVLSYEMGRVEEE